MKKLVLFLFLMFCMTSYGQDFLASLPFSYAADTSIVRWYTNQQCVMYTGSSSEGNFLHLINVSSGDIYSIEVEEDVTDMEILDDTLYYCGRLSGYFALLYYCPLQDFYNPFISVKGNRYTPVMGYYPKRLEVFRVSGGVHAVVVGDVVNPNRTDSFIADLWRNNSSYFWKTVKLLYTDNKECYDDIAVTDNYVVASGRVCTTGEIILRVLDKPTLACPLLSCSANYHIFYTCNTCEYTTYSYIGTDHNKVGGHGVYPVCITHTNGDDVVLACMVEDGSSTGISAKYIHIYSGAPTVLRNLCSWPGTMVREYYNLKDIRYDPHSDTLLMLVDLQQPSGRNRGILCLDNTAFSSLSFSFPVLAEESYDIHSIDRGDRWDLPKPDYFVCRKLSCGTKTAPAVGSTGIWSDAMSVDGCSDTKVIDHKEGIGKMVQVTLPALFEYNYNYYNVIDNRPVTHSNLYIECGNLRDSDN